MTSQVDQFGTTTAHQSGTLAAIRETLSRPVVLAMFVACATQPYGLEIGPLLIGPYRLVLTLVGPILMIQWLSGRFGRWLLPDFLILGHALWIFVALTANGQTNRLVEWGGAQFIDIFFAYLLGRAAIQNRQDFYFFTRVLLYVLLFLLPFAILESTQGIVILIRLAEGLPMLDAFAIITLEYPPRLGLLRAQAGSAHPILYGILCSMGMSFGLLGLAQAPGRPSFGKRMLLTSGSYLGTFFSLSSGAFASTGLQILLMLWNWSLSHWRARWRVLASASAIFYVFLYFFSERPPALVLGRLISFSPSTAWNRYMIWQFGSAEVTRNPIFGMGIFSDWVRAPWMPSSIDNQWLQQAMRFGLPGVGMLLGAFFYILYRLIRIDFSNNREMAAIRDSFVFVFIALLVAYGTVASWHIQWSLLMLLLGGATWIFTEHADKQAMDAVEDTEGTEVAEGEDKGQPRSLQRDRPRKPPATMPTYPRYSRFAPRSRAGSSSGPSGKPHGGSSRR